MVWLLEMHIPMLIELKIPVFQAPIGGYQTIFEVPKSLLTLRNLVSKITIIYKNRSIVLLNKQ